MSKREVADTDVSFGGWVQKRRKMLDLTQDELARHVGCSPSAIKKIEHDERRPSRQIAELLAEHLGLPADQRETFRRVARGHLRVERLSPPPFGAVHKPQPASSTLPSPPTPLVGREPELAALDQLLRDPSCRLLSIVGPGGIGKTRLAIGAAFRHQNAFSEGTFFVSLASLGSPEFLGSAIASALGFSFQGQAEPRIQLLNYLRDKQVLLVLDNVEHLLDGVGLFAEMLERAPGAKLLTTSRERLNLQGEWVFELQGLPAPPADHGERAGDYSAAALFMQSVRRVRADFEAKAEEWPSIARICRLVEGMPLGIELAATWVPVLSCHEIARELERNLDFLAASVRDLPERHRSMRAVFDHSWKLLSDEERAGLMRLTVFRGGFTREAVEQVAGATLPLLSALVTKSLVRRSDEKRYGMHELVRQYGFDQLESADEVERTRTAHLRAFVHLAEAIEPHLTQSDQGRWLASVDADHDNFRAALRWAFDSGDLESGLRLAGALWRFWHLHSYLAEGSQWLEQALQAAGPSAPAALRAKALIGAGSIAVFRNRLGEAVRWLEECLAMQPHLNESYIANAQLSLAFAVQEQLDFSRAQSLCEEALRRFRHLNDEYGIIRTLNNLGTLAYDKGNLDSADRLFGECLALARKRNDPDNIATSLTNMGWSTAIRGEVTMIGPCREALTLFRELGNKLGAAFCLEAIAAGIALIGQPDRAVRLFGAADALRETISAPLGGANARYLDAMLQPARGGLSETAFASAWAEGKAMTLEQAIADASAAEPA